MKKIVSMLLAFLMILSAIGCGAESPSGKPILPRTGYVLSAGGSVGIRPMLRDGSSYDDHAWQYSVGDETVAKLTGGNGTVVGAAPGETTLTVTDGNDPDLLLTARIRVLPEGEIPDVKDDLYGHFYGEAVRAAQQDPAYDPGSEIQGFRKLIQDSGQRKDAILSNITEKTGTWEKGTPEYTFDALLSTAEVPRAEHEAAVLSGMQELGRLADQSETVDDLIEFSSQMTARGEFSLFSILVGHQAQAETGNETGLGPRETIPVLERGNSTLVSSADIARINGTEAEFSEKLRQYIDCVLAQMGEDEETRSRNVPLVMEAVAPVFYDMNTLYAGIMAEHPEASNEEILSLAGVMPEIMTLGAAETRWENLRLSSWLGTAGFGLTEGSYIEMESPHYASVINALLAEGSAEKIREFLKFEIGSTYSRLTFDGYKAYRNAVFLQMIYTLPASPFRNPISRPLRTTSEAVCFPSWNGIFPPSTTGSISAIPPTAGNWRICAMKLSMSTGL